MRPPLSTFEEPGLTPKSFDTSVVLSGAPVSIAREVSSSL